MERKLHAKTPSLCNCINLRRASRAITEYYDQALASSGLKTTRFSLLRHIIRLGPLNMSELAKEIRLDRTTLARNVKLLEAQGYITISSGKDSRTRQISISEKGQKVVDGAVQAWKGAQESLQKYLGKQDLDTLTELLIKIERLVP
ncbi:MAG TPA: MarR family winged helix-turn-helix transcriptional regulator [Verrucomicrobiae bacterium]|nr:MarR family winged helix-turn-helix transcriptional regulator [Verrucomicrobiae bacterium]